MVTCESTTVEQPPFVEENQQPYITFNSSKASNLCLDHSSFRGFRMCIYLYLRIFPSNAAKS